MAAKKAPLSNEQKKFMAAQGLAQWLAASLKQGQRLRDIYTQEMPKIAELPPLERKLLIIRSHTEANFLASAAKHVVEYRKWAKELGLFDGVDFALLDKFSEQDITDLRNMREHVIDYFEGRGRAQDRWFQETPEYSADASSVVGTKIGGRLDYEAFTTACEVVLQDVLAHKDSEP